MWIVTVPSTTMHRFLVLNGHSHRMSTRIPQDPEGPDELDPDLEVEEKSWKLHQQAVDYQKH